MTATVPARRDIHAEVTAKIVAAIEADPGRPTMPWHRPSAPLVLPHNVLSDKAYQGINILTLWVAAEQAGYRSNLWGTYKQWQAHGCQVRKSEKSSLVVFYKEYDTTPDPDVTKPAPAEAGDDGRRRVARASFAFNAEQVDGFTPPPPPADLGPVARIAAVDAFVSATQAEIRHGGNHAYYRPSSDHIQMPHEGLFTGTATMDRSESYFAVLLHELTHWTAIPKRLDRQLGKRFGDHAYAMEEMVAELGAAMLCAELGIAAEPRLDHAQYIANWLAILKGDSRAIFAAAARASEAVRFLKRFSGAES